MSRIKFSKIFFALACLLIFYGKVFAEAENSRLDELLRGFVANDLELQKYVLTAESKKLLLSSAKIDNGISVELSTGEMKIQSSSDKTKISVTPSATLSIPKANGTELSASLPYTVENGEKTLKNGSISLETGIITSQSKKAKINILEAERAYTEAKRNVRDRALSAEKEFYESLKKLYGYAISISALKTDLYDDSVDLKVLETQGYSKTSAKYRQAYLKVESDKRDIMEKQRLLERETAVFAQKCGFTYGRSIEYTDDNSDREKAAENAYLSSMEFLPDSIPQVDEVNIFKFSPKTYSKIESAEWDKYIGQLKRDSDYDMTLTAGLGYIINNDFLADDNTNAASDSVEGKLTWKWTGISASAGVGLPTGSSITGGSCDKTFNPYYSFSLSLSPNDWRLSKLEKQQDKIDEKLESIAVKSAEDDYQTELLDKTSTFHDLKWSENSYAEEFDMYTKLESDMAAWLKQGIVTESDYLDAKNNKEKARLNVMINEIEQIIFNNEVKLLFHDDAE